MRTIGDVIENEYDPYWAHAQAIHEIVFDRGIEKLDRLSRESRLAYLVGSFHGTVCNGGFDSFIAGSLGGRGTEIAAALKTLGADEASRIVEELLSVFPDGVAPDDRVARDDLWCDLIADPRISKRVERLEVRYSAVAEDPIERLRRFLVRNAHAPLAS